MVVVVELMGFWTCLYSSQLTPTHPHIDKTAEIMDSTTAGKLEKGQHQQSQQPETSPASNFVSSLPTELQREHQQQHQTETCGWMDGCGKEKHFLAEVGVRETTTTPSDRERNL